MVLREGRMPRSGATEEERPPANTTRDIPVVVLSPR